MADYPHVDAAFAYATAVVGKKIPACKWVRLACKRHLTDLKKAKRKVYPYRFDPA
jgi:phage terminase large subunit-like protein